MKKLASLIMAILIAIMPMNLSFANEDNAPLSVSSKSAILMDVGSGQILYEKNAHDKLPPASVTKVMTMLLICEALDSGKITLDDSVQISDNAASMGGSQIFLEAGEVQKVDTLLKGIAVASANDGCVAMAEYIGGSVESFVDMMNAKAKELNMKDTNFVNTNGLPVDNHYTSAHDIAIMSRELLKHDVISKYLTTWMDQVVVGKKQITVGPVSYTHLDVYKRQVFNMVGDNDVVYIASSFPSKLAYKNKERLSPIIKFKGNEKGLLSSSTTRRDGIVANIDVGVDILNEFGLENKSMVGRAYSLIQKDDNVDFLSYELEKMATISNIRSTVVNTFVGVVSVSWVIGMVAILFRNRIPNKDKVFNVIKEFIKLGIIMPLVFLLAPIFNFKTPVSMTIGIIITTLALYLLGRVLFKDDLKQMGFFALITILVIVIDCIFGTYLMKNNIMSYDAIIGARYYGVGNEYEGVSIASPIFAFAILLNYNKKLPKWSIIIASIVILITSAYPTMGANVGGAISQTAAYLLFIMLIFDVKLDLKKVILIGISVVAVVGAFAFFDIVSGSESHLGLFVQQIFLNGPSAIIQTFARKIGMNVKLAQTSVWVNILLAGIFIIGIFIIKPPRQFRMIAKRYPMIFKGFIASMVGCIVTLLVNDSGIVAASTASIYILIPLIIISINMLVPENKEND